MALSMNDLGDVIGYGIETIHEYETNKRPATKAYLYALMYLLEGDNLMEAMEGSDVERLTRSLKYMRTCGHCGHRKRRFPYGHRD